MLSYDEFFWAAERQESNSVRSKCLSYFNIIPSLSLYFYNFSDVIQEDL